MTDDKNKNGQLPDSSLPEENQPITPRNGNGFKTLKSVDDLLANLDEK